MPNVSNDHPAICVKKFVIFHIGGYIDIGPGAQRLRDKKTPCTAAQGHTSNWFV